MISPHLIASTGDSRHTRNMSFEASDERILLFVYLDKRKFQLNGSRFEFGATGPGLMLWFSFRCYSQSVVRNGIFSSMPLSLRVVSLLTESHKLNRDRRSIISWQTSASQMGHTLVYVDIISRFSWLLFICRVSAEYFGRCESLSVATIIWSNFASDSPMTQWFLFTLSNSNLRETMKVAIQLHHDFPVQKVPDNSTEQRIANEESNLWNSIFRRQSPCIEVVRICIRVAAASPSSSDRRRVSMTTANNSVIEGGANVQSR